MRQYVTPSAVANEVRLLRTQDNRALLIVEGATDKRTFRNLVDRTACQIVIAHGRENALTALAILEADDFQGVLAVIDADFDRLNNAPLPSPSALLTDLHDIECMMVASSAFGKLVGEFADPARVESFESHIGCGLAEAIARNAMPLGYLRWVSLRHRLDLRFEELPYHRFVARANLQIDLGKLLQTVKNHSQRPDIANSFLEQQVAAVTDPTHDRWQVCCGHDLLEILSVALRHTIAGRDAHEVKREVLERELRLAYENTYFQGTALALAVRNWENGHQPYRVLASR